MDERKEKLSFKQEQFVNAYLGEANGNGRQAALMAGYSGNDETLSSVASENLTKPAIIAHISARMLELRAGPDRIVEMLLDVAEFPMDEIIRLGKDAKMTAGDKVRALELLGKRHRMFVDRSENTSTTVHRIEVTSIEAIKPQIVEGSAKQLPTITDNNKE